MSSQEIIKFCFEKGLLIDKDILNLLNNLEDIDSIKLIIKEINQKTQQKLITKEVFVKNLNELEKIFSELPQEKKFVLEKLKINLGLNIEISKEVVSKLDLEKIQRTQETSGDYEGLGELKSSVSQPGSEIQQSYRGQQNQQIGETKNLEGQKQDTSMQQDFFKKSSENTSQSDLDLGVNSGVKIKKSYFIKSKKLAVEDFVNYFRNRFLELKKILQSHPGLDNLISINKLSSSRQNVSLIGIVTDKQITKNKNLLLTVEDLTGVIKVLVNRNKEEIYKKTEEIALDSVLGFKGVGNREIVFINDVIFPEASLPERKKADIEEYALFVGDLHIGSKNFMEKNFLRFIDYLNGKVLGTEEEVSKIRYLFVVGDLIAGVGVYPGQEFEIELKDLESQFERVAELFKKIPERIKIIISPGNHDGIRLMEPQPLFDEKYAWPLFDLKNVVLTTNPSVVNIASNKSFDGFDVLVYHGFSFFYYADNIFPLMIKEAVHNPELIMKYLLKNRHLAPTHASVQYFPNDEDSHLIKEVPDIFVTGHLHKSSVSYFNNILCISVSTWESLTDYMEKRGARPDFCKVPMFNLKTRAVKILDFE